MDGTFRGDHSNLSCSPAERERRHLVSLEPVCGGRGAEAVREALGEKGGHVRDPKERRSY